MVQAIIFDCDGVLVDSEVLAIRGEREALATFGLHYDPPAYVDRFVGMHDDLFFETLREEFQRRYGKPAPSNFEEDILDGRRRFKNDLRAVGGADAALRKARECVSQIAVASSSRTHFLQSKLERTRLFDLVAPHVYSADLVEHGKPAPDIFLYAAERVGVPPEQCLVLEDSRNGILAARAAGMDVWGFVGGGHCYPAYADKLTDAGATRVIPDFAAFEAALDDLPKHGS